MNRMGLESLIGEVNHKPVLVGIPLHENLAALGFDDDTLNVGYEAQGPLERFHTHPVIQAGNLES